MDQEIGSALTGMMESLNGYLGMKNQMIVKNNMAEQEHSRDRQDYLWKKSVDQAMQEPHRTIPIENLEKLNPAFGQLGFAKGTQIPVSELSEYSHIIPKHENDSSNFLTPQETASSLYMMGVPESKISDILLDFNKRGVKRVSKNLLDESAKSFGKNPASFDQRLRIFSQSVSPDDEQFMDKFKAWDTKLNEYNNPKSDTVKSSLGDTEVDQMAAKASSVYEGYVKGGMTPADALNKTTDQLGEIYDGSSVSKVMDRIDHRQNPRPKSPMPGFRDIARKLLGNK